MLLPLDLILVINAVFVLIIFVSTAAMIRMSVIFSRSVGDNAIQEPLKWRIIRLVMFMFFVTLLAAIFNFLLV